MHTTYELRWFYPGKIPEDIQNWFEQHCPEFSAQPVSTHEDIDNGCSVELAHLVIQNDAWWSLAFEAFGEDAHLMNNLQVTASWVFNSYRGVKLLAADSFAYPSWLALFCEAGNWDNSE